MIAELKATEHGQVLVVPGIACVLDTEAQLTISDHSVSLLQVATALKGETCSDGVGGHVAITSVDILAASILTIMGSIGVVLSVDTTVLSVHRISIVKLIFIDAQHRSIEVIHEEEGRDYIQSFCVPFIISSRTIVGVGSQLINTVGQALYYLRSLKCGVVTSSHGIYIQEAQIAVYVPVATIARGLAIPTIPFFIGIEIGVHYQSSGI